MRCCHAGPKYACMLSSNPYTQAYHAPTTLCHLFCLLLGPALGDGSAQFEKRTGNHTHMPLDRLCILQVSVDEEELDRGQSQPATVREPTIAARMAACSKCHLAAPCTYLEVGAFAAECAVDAFSAEFDRIASMHQPPGTPFTSFPAVLGCCRDVSSSELRHGWF